MNKALIFDLDDTLIDTKKRHYQIVRLFLQQTHCINIPTYDEYVSLRKQYLYTNENIVGRYIDDEIVRSGFKKYFLQNIEHEIFLELDTPIIDSLLLQQLKKLQYVMIVVSLRSNTENAIGQFNKFDFRQYIDNVYFIPHIKNQNPKIQVVETLKRQFELCLFAGDSTIDFEAAQKNNITFHGVQTGFYQHTFSSYTDINSALKQFISKQHLTNL